MSLRILLTTFGSYGDIHPYMALALGLKARGHRAVIGTSEVYREKIKSAGLEFSPVRPDLPHGAESDALLRRVMDLRTGTETVIREVALGSLRDSYADISAAAANGCDLILSHGLTYASPIVAEQLNIPWVFVALQPIIFFSAHDPSPPPAAPWLTHLRKLGPRAYRSLMDLGMKRLAHWAEPINALRRGLGLPPASSNPVLRGQYSPYLNLALFSKQFAPAMPDWPARTVQTGFAFYDQYDRFQAPMPDNLTQFLDSGEPPIVFTLGTAAVRDAGRFYEESITAARRLGKRAVLLTGFETGNTEGLELSSDVIAVDYAPYSELFPRAAVNVHQGGIGTTAQALRAGRPMLVMPYAHDQPDNAARCERLGVARHIARVKYDAAHSERALKALLNDPSIAVRAAELGRAIRSEDGVSAACDAIEKI